MPAIVATIKGKLGQLRSALDMLVASPISPPRLPAAIESLDLQGKRALVSGSSSGIGYAIALYFAGRGAEVHMLCRNEAKAIRARDAIRAETGNEQVFVEVVEMSSLKSVQDFVDRWTARSPEARKIDMLMNNAGGASSSKRTTEDGFEVIYQTNFLSIVLLTSSLLRRFCFAFDARIVQTTSHGVYGSPPLDPAAPKTPAIMDGIEEGAKLPFATALAAYAESKAALVVWAKELQERLEKTEEHKNIVLQCANPGWVSTPIWNDPSGLAGLGGPIHKVAIWMDSKIGVTPAQGAAVLVWLATSKEAAAPAVRAKHWDWLHVKWTPGWMGDPALRHALMKRWEEDAGVQDSF